MFRRDSREQDDGGGSVALLRFQRKQTTRCNKSPMSLGQVLLMFCDCLCYGVGNSSSSSSSRRQNVPSGNGTGGCTLYASTNKPETIFRCRVNFTEEGFSLASLSGRQSMPVALSSPLKPRTEGDRGKSTSREPFPRNKLL